MSELTLVAASTRRSLEDAMVGLFGLATSLLTAGVLWSITFLFGISIYAFTFRFVVPVGAIGAGFAGATGYFVGAKLFNHRPTRLLLLNIVIASVATFFMIHYLSYRFRHVGGRPISELISFTQYLDIAIRSTSFAIGLRPGPTLGALGYVVALLQIVGFCIGGGVVYRWLLSEPSCDTCSRYLDVQDRFMRYTLYVDAWREHTTRVSGLLNGGDVAAALDAHKAFGKAAPSEGEHLRSVIEMRGCKTCGHQWAVFSTQLDSSSGWKTVSGDSVTTCTRAVLSSACT